MRLTIEVTEDELQFIRRNCILRPIKEAERLLNEARYASDTDEQDGLGTANELGPLGRLMEEIRHKLVQASFR